MATVDSTIGPFKAGNNITREEFLRRSETLPELKRAELVGGVVYIMSSPLSSDYGDCDFNVGGWLSGACPKLCVSGVLCS